MASEDLGQAHNVSCTEQLILMIYLRAFGRWPSPKWSRKTEVKRRVGSGGSDADPVFNLRPVRRRRVSEREAFSHVAQHQKWRPMLQKVGDHATLGASFPQEHLRFPAVCTGTSPRRRRRRSEKGWSHTGGKIPSDCFLQESVSP